MKRGTDRELSLFKAQKDTVAMHLKPGIDLKYFAGRYINPVYGYLDISKTGDKLKMVFEHHPNLT
jgi:hypothetical protein